MPEGLHRPFNREVSCARTLPGLPWHWHQTEWFKLYHSSSPFTFICFLFLFLLRFTYRACSESQNAFYAQMELLEIIFDLPIGFPINNIISLCWFFLRGLDFFDLFSSVIGCSSLLLQHFRFSSKMPEVIASAKWCTTKWPRALYFIPWLPKASVLYSSAPPHVCLKGKQICSNMSHNHVDSFFSPTLKVSASWFVPLSFVWTSQFVPLPVWDHSQGVYFPPNSRRSIVFRILFQQTNKQTNKQSFSNSLHSHNSVSALHIV